MRQRTILIINSLTQVFSRIFTVGTRFLLVPFAMGVLGREYYGLWVVVGSIFAYTRFIEAGLRGAVVRQVAAGTARGDHADVQRYVNTAAGYFLGVAAVVLTASLVLCIWFPAWFKVDPRIATASRIMVVITGLSLALSIAQYAHMSILSGLQREDVASGAQIGVDLLNLAIVLVFLRRFEVGGGLVVLAIASGGATLLGTLARTLAARRLYPSIRYEPWLMDRRLVWDMAAFGFNTVVYMMTVTAAAQLALIVIGAVVSTASAADFRVAMEMIVGVHTFVIASTISVKAAAGRYDGENNTAMLRMLLIRSTRYASLVTLAGVIGLIVFCEPFLKLWQGRNYAGESGAARLDAIAGTLRILAIGYGAFWLTMPAFNVANGMGKHRFPARLAIGSCLASMFLVYLVVSTGRPTLPAIALGVVAPVIPACLGAMLWYACRVVAQPGARFVHEGLLVPLLGLIPATLLGWWLTSRHPAQGWMTLIGQIALCGLVTIPTAWWLVLVPGDRASFQKELTRRLRLA